MFAALDNLIVSIWTAILRGIMYAGTALVYVQFFIVAGLVLFLGAATVASIAHGFGLIP